MRRSTLFTEELHDLFEPSLEAIAAAHPLVMQAEHVGVLSTFCQEKCAKAKPGKCAILTDDLHRALLDFAVDMADRGVELVGFAATVAGFIVADNPSEERLDTLKDFLTSLDRQITKAAAKQEIMASEATDEARPNLLVLAHRAFLCAARAVPLERSFGDFLRDRVQAVLADAYEDDAALFEAFLSEGVLGGERFPAGHSILTAAFIEILNGPYVEDYRDAVPERVAMLSYQLKICAGVACRHAGQSPLGQAATKLYSPRWDELVSLDPTWAAQVLNDSRRLIADSESGRNEAFIKLVGAKAGKVQHQRVNELMGLIIDNEGSVPPAPEGQSKRLKLKQTVAMPR